MRGVTVGKLGSTATLLEREKSSVTVLFLYVLSSLWVGVCVKLIRMSGLAGNLELVLLCFQSFKFSKSLWWDSVAQWITVRKSDRTLLPMFRPFEQRFSASFFLVAARGYVLITAVPFLCMLQWRRSFNSFPIVSKQKRGGGKWRGSLFGYLCWLFAFVVVCYLHSKVNRPNNIVAKVERMESKFCLGIADYSLL